MAFQSGKHLFHTSPGSTGFWSSAIANDSHFKAAIIVYPGVQQEKEIQ